MTMKSQARVDEKSKKNQWSTVYQFICLILPPLETCSHLRLSNALLTSLSKQSEQGLSLLLGNSRLFSSFRCKMFANVTPKKAITFTKYSVILCCGWPLPSRAPKSHFYFYVIAKVLISLSTISVILPVFWSLLLYIHDPVRTGKTFGLLTAMCQTVVYIIVCSFQHDHYQRLIEEMTDYVEKAKLYEMVIFQRYLDTYSSFLGITTISFYVAATVIVISTLFTDQPFPVIAEFPFRVDYEPVRSTIFLNIAFVALQNVASVSLNTLTALLVLFAAARYDIVMLELQSAVTVADLKECMRKYREVKRCALDTIDGVQYVTLVTLLFSSVILVNAGLNLIGRREFLIKCQNVFVASTALLEVFSCVLPADRLIEAVYAPPCCAASATVRWQSKLASTGTIRSVYDVKWYERDLSVQKTVYQMLVPQKPVIISFLFVVPELSLNYYCSYISNAFSLFTALRLVLSETDDAASSNNFNTTCCYN
ncbi:uncharacterized protein LOC143210812 [Lasioglossum baleicum]|uniref:uncharacterized protein LOC143210812 n=1 Tax=Lasioglossum baleicum TaxID=434251 RepID=UPI003FCD5C2E